MNINDYYSDKLKTITKIDKILCIIEGKTELSFLKKIYELNNTNIDCNDFISTIVKISWGKDEIILKNHDCDFQGGNLKSCPTPMPVIESLEKEDLEIYSSILVCFDKDCDKDNIVENYTLETLKYLKHKLLLSSPCFENSILHLCGHDTTFTYVSKNYEIIDDSLCQWFKNNFSKIPKIKKFSRCQKAERVIEKIDTTDLLNISNQELKNFIDFLMEEMK